MTTLDFSYFQGHALQNIKESKLKLFHALDHKIKILSHLTMI